jgi:hypothetical protein
MKDILIYKNEVTKYIVTCYETCNEFLRSKKVLITSFIYFKFLV